MNELLKPKALITGLRGFTGRYLEQVLVAAGYQVFGLSFGAEASGEHVYSVDLADRAGLERVIDLVQPHVVAHLAGISFAAHGDANAIYQTNLLGTRNLLATLASAAKPPQAVLLASSAHVYGNATVEPITETTAVAPVSDYAVSKLAMEHMARLWMEQLPIIIVRPFNYTGPGQLEHFLLPKMVKHFRERATEIELGNLDVARDFSDVRRVVEAYRRLLEIAPAGEIFNICSGVAYSLQDVLQMLQNSAGYRIKVRVNPAFIRSNEVQRLVGSCDKLIQAVGTVPEYALQDTLEWMLQS